MNKEIQCPICGTKINKLMSEGLEMPCPKCGWVRIIFKEDNKNDTR